MRGYLLVFNVITVHAVSILYKRRVVKMDVRYLGFHLALEGAGEMSFVNLAEHLEETPEIFTNDSSSRQIYIDSKSDDNWYKGLVVTIKDQRRFCRMSNTGDGFKIIVDDLLGDDRLLEFNFFIINKKNGLGLYQHYFHSCALNLFGEYLKRLFKSINTSNIATEIALEEARGGKLSKKRTTGIRKNNLVKLKFSPLVMQDSLESILTEYDKIKSFEFEYSVLTDDVRLGTPLSPYVRVKREKLYFESNSNFENLARDIASFVKREKPRAGRVQVEDLDGESTSLKIFDMPDCFMREDFEQVVRKLDGLELKHFSSHGTFDDLKSVAESDDYEHIFMGKVEHA